jgi:toxin-antitoxin system PIN domain toxin
VRYLLDVNCLLAAIWTTHTDHAKADAWVQDKELATCPISELGFLRISTHPKALNCDMTSARALLDDFLSKHSVAFLPADLPSLKSKAARSGAVTDIYLADLAASKRIKLATLDTGIDHQAIEIIS